MTADPLTPPFAPPRFEFATATRIIFGAGSFAEIGPLAAAFGLRALVVGGSTPARLKPLLALLQAHGVYAHSFRVPTEPTLELVAEGTREAHAHRCDVVIGMGGGSALDAGKAIAALLTNAGEVRDYLEVIGRSRPLEQPSAPFLALPTTAGTGAEVTRNAVLSAPEARLKVSLRSPHLLPRVALIDPELSLSVPPALTASTGLDALTQCLEPFVSPQANPLTDALCREGLGRAARALRRAHEDGSDLRARTDMALASLCGGLALANAKLGAVHGLAAPLGGAFPAPHGGVCARLLPLVMAANLRALRPGDPASGALARYAEVAQLLTGDPRSSAEDGVRWVQELCTDLQVAPLSAFGVTEAAIPEIVAKAARGSSMQGNPVALREDELARVLQDAL